MFHRGPWTVISYQSPRLIVTLRPFKGMNATTQMESQNMSFLRTSNMIELTRNQGNTKKSTLWSSRLGQFAAKDCLCSSPIIFCSKYLTNPKFAAVTRGSFAKVAPNESSESKCLMTEQLKYTHRDYALIVCYSECPIPCSVVLM